MDKALFSIVAKIKFLRKEKGLTVQHLAEKTGYTKAFISKVENKRVMPSLPALLTIINVLGESLEDFFSDILLYEHLSEKKYLYLPRSEYTEIVREDSEGYHYQLIHSCSFNKVNIDVVLLELRPGSRREMAETEGFELFMVLSGCVKFQLDKEFVVLQEGDSLYFDGRVSHRPLNHHTGKSLCLVLYFLA